MKRDPLDSLLRLRRLTEDHARKELADCIRTEGQAGAAVAAIEAEIDRETDLATSLTASDADVEAYAAWLRRIRPNQRAAHASEDAAAVETAEARTVLSMARTAVRAVEEILERQKAAERSDAERQSQREIDEAAARRRKNDPA